MDPKLLKYVEYPIIIFILLITIISVLVISSATHAIAGENFHYTKMQIIWFLAGLVVMSIVIAVDYHSIANYSNTIYVLNIFATLLVIAIGIGKQSTGAQRWIPIGPFGLQPSEFAKLAIIITLSKYLEKKKPIKTIKDLLPVAFHVGIPMIIVAKQPDLGTALVLIAIMFGIIFVAGISYKLLGGIIGAGILSIPVLWKFLHGYQKNRILVFLNPYLDPLGAGYQVIQSKIAIGSGKIFGKGLFRGTQNQLDFLPVRHTDFIFAVLGEEWGLIGGIILFSLYFGLIYFTVKVAFKARDLLGTYISIGIASMWTFQVLVNIGMNIGIMPVTGIPLPFMSYGGSSFLMNMMAAGLVINIGMRRQKILF